MATVREIITGAWRLTGLPGSNEEPSAEDISYGLELLNDMCNSWLKKSVYTGFSTVTDLASEFILDEGHHGAVKALLAQKLLETNGGEVPRGLAKEAYDGWLAIKADYRPIDTLQVDRALQRMPSQRIYW